MSHVLFQLLVMLVEGPADAEAIRKRMRAAIAKSDMPSIPAFYRHLKSGIDKGWIEVRGVRTPGDGPGRPRQSYALTARGRSAMRDRATWLEKLTSLAFETGGR